MHSSSLASLLRDSAGDAGPVQKRFSNMPCCFSVGPAPIQLKYYSINIIYNFQDKCKLLFFRPSLRSHRRHDREYWSGEQDVTAEAAAPYRRNGPSRKCASIGSLTGPSLPRSPDGGRPFRRRLYQENNRKHWTGASTCSMSSGSLRPTRSGSRSGV